MANASLPKGQTAKQPATGAGAKGGAKRAYHTKTRTGCKTCKIRRVRCDEEKPRCKRCVSTGRKCDGYDTTSNYSLPTAQWPPDNITASADLALVKSGKSPEELRSYRFFIDVTAPSVGGALNATLWNEELPRVCLHDPAIWHAIVSLGSAHESYVSGIPAGPDNVFTLKHYDSAIASLTSSYTPRGWWRALTLSTIFSAICVLEGRYEEARLHFRSGYNLISEFDTPHPPGTDLVTGQEVHKLKRLTSTFPVSLTSIRAAMIEFEMRENKANAKKVSQLPSLLSGKDSFASWRTYTSPSSSLPGECLNERNIGEAIRNGESLFMNLLFSTMQHGNKLRKYYTEGRMHMLGAPGPTQEPFQRCFKELDDALRAFTAEFTTRVTQGWKKGDAELRQAWLSLCLIHATIRFMLRRDPDEPDEVKRLASLQLQGEGILDLAEKVMNLERNLGCIRSGGAIPNPTVMNPIVVVARTGVGLATRKRALDLLYRPRLEGLWDCLMGASYCKAIMDREAAATREYNEIGVERTWIDDYTARGYDAGEDEPEEDVHPMARIYGTEFPFVGGRRAILKLRTWREWLRGDEGEEFWIYW